ncbi:hypothetical protein C4K24_3080 [Pseudomonas chlororaphis subsp. aurantiaca]|uniref:hypothetical protein n=2 Tax=Pseudomonas chlororaphis TaxID=587753 RepID=UPI000F6ECA80|nr:hypothetical protein [Pseudomonas chlororaphis]AZD22383.1 hypothetical protein C4K24_3080 [Pseudomonas chlororaphis subsp. aurantiaca]
MKLIQCRFSSGQRVPLLVRTGDAAPLPILVTETAPFPQIDSRTRDQNLRLLKQFLSWCVTRYIPRARQNSTTLANIEVVFADVAGVIERRGLWQTVGIRHGKRGSVLWGIFAPDGRTLS